MRVLLVLLLFAAMAPDAHARSGPCRTGDVPRVTAKQHVTKVGWRYAVVACDADRRMRVLRRTRVRNSVKRGSLGRSIVDAESAGGHIVWGELVYRRNPQREQAVVVEADRRGRVTRRRTVWRAREQRDPLLDVGVLRDGSVAWSVPGRRPVVRLARPGRRPVTLRPGYRSGLTAEDGRTLRWERPNGRFSFRDVLPLPVRDGCPRRSRARTVSETGKYRVTEAGYGFEDETLLRQVLRVCVRAERRDLVVAQGDSGYVREVTLLAEGWAVVWGQSYSKYDCPFETVVRVSLRRRPRAPRSAVHDRCGDGPRAGVMQVVTPAGRVAWVDEPDPSFGVEPPETDTVLRATAGDRSVVLDRGAPGAITELRADGETYRWRNAGVERSAPAP